MSQYLPSETELENLGSYLAQHCHCNVVIYLHGNLGSGKTTFARGFLRGLGYFGKVKSPTYTLVESYNLATFTVYHFDLYRLNDPEELDYLGLRDYLQNNVICLIEWAERGQGAIPPPDIECHLHYQTVGRTATFHATTPTGIALLAAVDANSSATG